MTRSSRLAALLAVSSLAALPACSMLGGNHDRSASTGATSRSYAAAPSSAPAQTASSQTAELTPDMIRNVQQNLTQDGMYHGRVDGVWGQQTQSAVRNFQQQHNMNATGQLDRDTLSAMNLNTGADQNAGQQPNQNSSNYNPPPNNPPPDNTNRTP
jgi:peptidoglycan hydrolase-like protein with peptidoglycan-binding domain